MTVATQPSPAPVPLDGQPSPVWHFTLALPAIVQCDLCLWTEQFQGGTSASNLLNALWCHHAFVCPALR